METRTWGDGGGKTRRHEIEVMSYAVKMIACGVDHEVVRFGETPADIAWNQHRGISFTVEQAVVDRAALATDAEVSEFLKWVAREDGDDRLPPTVSRSAVYRVDHATGDMETRAEFLDEIREMQARCTCATTAVTDCPNYAEGDEVDTDEDS
jgi:hypothetical protein